MKLITVLILATCLTAAATGNAQRITLSEKNATLEKIFKEIKKQTGIDFFYNMRAMERANKVDIKVKDVTLDEALAICFQNQPLTYTINSEMVVVKEKEGEAGHSGDVKNVSPPIDISGKVTDADGKPLAGANIHVQGSNKTATTDANGVFVLKGVDENATLEISFAEYETVVLKVDKRNSIILSLKRQITSLNEVIVNKGYYTEKMRYTVGNVTTVKAADIEKQPVSNPLLALQGRVPGLEVKQLTGMNGGGVTVRIQGRNSLNSGLEPLIVIDGVPYPSVLEYTGVFLDGGLQSLGQAGGIVKGGSPLNYINPADIESIDVLKDADATAIYGSRAANGAILITTKKGKIGKTKLSVNLQRGWGRVANKVKMMNTRQYLEMRYEAYKNDGIDISTLTPRSSNYDLTLWDTTRYTDWQKELIGSTARYSNISTSLSGGNATTQYLLGATFNRQTDVFPGDFDDKKGGVHFSVGGASTNQKLRVRLSGNYMYDQNGLPSIDLTNQALFFSPNAPALYNADGTVNWALNAAGSSTWDNPLAAYIQNSEFEISTKNLVSNAILSYSILPELEVRSSFGYIHLQSNLYRAVRLDANRPENRPFVERFAEFSTRNMGSWIIEPQLQYKRKLGKTKLDGLVGATIQQNSSDVLTTECRGFTSDLVMKFILAATSRTISLASSNMYKYNALFGRLNYNWDDKYLVNLTVRRDGSSRFGDKNKFQNFGSGGVGWIFSEEKWIQKNLSFLSFGKLRTSYGTTGNDQIADYSYLSYYGVGGTSGILYQNSPILNVSSIPNPHLQWEETRKWQWGIDLGFLDDRMLLNATFARNRSSNQLIGYTIPSITGYNSITQNFPATIQNTSLEFMLNTTNIKSKDLIWSSSFNITFPQNKLIKFPDIEKTAYGGPLSSVVVGQPLGFIRLFRYAGVDPATGDYQVFDKHGNPTTFSNVTIDDLNVFLSDLSKYYGGLQNSITYKGLQLDFIFQFVRVKASKDLYYWNGNNLAPGMYVRRGGNQPVTVLDRWQKPGDNAPIARYTTRSTNVAVMSSDAGYTYDASYIRLENLSLTWQLPAYWIQKVHLQDARLYFRGQNLATITKYPGLDPETRSASSLPPLRIMTVGVQMEF